MIVYLRRRRIVMDYLDSGGKLNKQQGSITCRKNKNGIFLFSQFLNENRF
jgi:hypothetical protein